MVWVLAVMLLAVIAAAVLVGPRPGPCLWRDSRGVLPRLICATGKP
jgi:hypothetical protein